jgi:glycosyltransferase involved in cell wall biosynthesis
LNRPCKPLVVVVSPFLDNAFGTERIIIRWITKLADDFDIHIYSQRVQDLDLSQFTFHRVPSISGPHILKYLFWYFANQIVRARDRWFRGLRPDIVFSPGVNCPDADVISVHIIFKKFTRQSAAELHFSRTPISGWPRLLHRRLYYRMVIFFENRVYRKDSNYLVLIANKTAGDLKRYYGRTDRYLVLFLGLDHSIFNNDRRLSIRDKARAALGYSPDDFVVLLVGNDLRNKGFRVLIESMNVLRKSQIKMLVATRDDLTPFRAIVAASNLAERVQFCPPRKDIEFYYAAADAYAGPSLEDTFALPPSEAMACGLPTLVSRENGTMEIIEHGVNGLILDDPTDAASLAKMLLKLSNDPAFAARIGANGAETARQLTWERNAEDLRGIFAKILARNEPNSARETSSHADADSSAASK